MEKNQGGLTIAIDGPSGAGKSTIAKEVAKRLGYLYIDTGAMYRAVGLKALQLNPQLEDVSKIITVAATSRIELKDDHGLLRVLLDGSDVTEAIRFESVSQAASIVSSVSEVRQILVRAQQELGAAGSVVMEGRDIGTKVFPNADLKIYMDASEATRARRRLEDNKRRGNLFTLEEIISEIRERDRRDCQRADSPLIKTEDAVYIDTSEMTVEEVIQAVLRLVEERRSTLQSKSTRF
jgi:cytidylate kinase